MKSLFIISVIFNFLFNIMFLFVLNKCNTRQEECPLRSFDTEYPTVLGQLYFVLPFFSLGLYMVFLFLDVPLLVSLINSFRVNFSEVFNEGNFKCKLILYFVIKEFFIMIRGFFYFEINFNPNGDNIHIIKLVTYISEIALTLNMMFVAYKNL